MTFIKGDIVNNKMYNFEVIRPVSHKRDLMVVKYIDPSMKGCALVPIVDLVRGTIAEQKSREFTYEEMNAMSIETLVNSEFPDATYFGYLTLDNRIRLLTELKRYYCLIPSRRDTFGTFFEKLYVHIFANISTLEDHAILTNILRLPNTIPAIIKVNDHLSESDRVFITLGGT